ncbi:Serine/threonine-protein kinase [Saitoella coloradoensis]
MQPRPGLLRVYLTEGKDISLPPATQLPIEVAHALETHGTNPWSAPTSRSEASNKRQSLGPRKPVWYLPYVVLEFDKNEIIVDALYAHPPEHGLASGISAPTWAYSTNFDVSRSSGSLSMHVYLRQTGRPSSARPSTATATSASLRSTSRLNAGHGAKDMSRDIYLGGCQLTPHFSSSSPFDAWIPLSGGSGSVHLRTEYKPASTPITIEDFDLLKVVGKGSFGKVMQVRKRDTSRIYALKTLRKAHIVARSEVVHTLAERTVLAQINNPFIVPLKFSFQSPEKLYLVLAFVNGGELFHHLQREGRFSVERARFYAAELLLALECLHDYNVIYRDLKPENILLDYTGHIALCDFGLCKLNMSPTSKTNTFCGTPEYLAPELLLGQGYTKAVDWWTLGVLLYEMLSGLPPFYDENTNEMYRRILQDPLRFGDEIGRDARDLLTKLLNRDPAHRLGTGPTGAQEIKSHPFFASHIDFRKLYQKKIQPPFKPSVESAVDTSNFDPEFTSEVPMDSVVEDSRLSETVQRQFAGWSFVPGGGVGSVVGGGGRSVIG